MHVSSETSSRAHTVHFTPPCDHYHVNLRSRWRLGLREHFGRCESAVCISSVFTLRRCPDFSKSFTDCVCVCVCVLCDCGSIFSVKPQSVQMETWGKHCHHCPHDIRFLNHKHTNEYSETHGDNDAHTHVFTWIFVWLVLRRRRKREKKGQRRKKRKKRGTRTRIQGTPYLRG